MSTVKSTLDYEQFKLREDNREAVNQSHVKRLAESIKARNLLELRPISVNGGMEVIDGQHRLLAAKSLGVPIYYIQNSELHSKDIILMNVSQPWGQMDYLNYYVKNGQHEYIKLAEFMKKNSISIKVALAITLGHTNDAHIRFKSGEYVFNGEEVAEEIEICWETIFYIKKINGYSAYTHSTRFWRALLTVIRHANFDLRKWRDNLKRMVERCTPKASQEDYLNMLMDIHNWRNQQRIEV